MISEKRRFLRLPASTHIQFKRIGYTQARKKLSKDISIAGIRFLSDQFIPIFSHIKVNLQVEEDEMPVQFIAQVMWVNALYNGESYEVGAQILEISRQAQDRLKRYIGVLRTLGEA
jgi:hypothetical protein